MENRLGNKRRKVIKSHSIKTSRVIGEAVYLCRLHKPDLGNHIWVNSVGLIHEICERVGFTADMAKVPGRPYIMDCWDFLRRRLETPLGKKYFRKEKILSVGMTSKKRYHTIYFLRENE